MPTKIHHKATAINELTNELRNEMIHELTKYKHDEHWPSVLDLLHKVLHERILKVEKEREEKKST